MQVLLLGVESTFASGASCDRSHHWSVSWRFLHEWNVFFWQKVREYLDMFRSYRKELKWQNHSCPFHFKSLCCDPPRDCDLFCWRCSHVVLRSGICLQPNSKWQWEFLWIGCHRFAVSTEPWILAMGPGCAEKFGITPGRRKRREAKHVQKSGIDFKSDCFVLWSCLFPIIAEYQCNCSQQTQLSYVEQGNKIHCMMIAWNWGKSTWDTSKIDFMTDEYVYPKVSGSESQTFTWIFLTSSEVIVCNYM